MKYFVCSFLFSILMATKLSGQDTNDQLFYLVKTWGLLKYYHPAVITGKPDWNRVFVEQANAILNNPGKNVASIAEELINSAGRTITKTSSRSLYDEYKNTPYANLNLDWLNAKDSPLTEADKNYLQQMVRQFSPASNVYVGREINKYYFNDPRNKYWYSSNNTPDKANALLSLARYWNIINYFYPHKDRLSKSWDNTLREFIPEALKHAGQKEIYTVFAALSASINDGHAFFNNYEFDSIIGLHRPAMAVSFINRQTAVSYISDSLKSITGISKGDVINRLNGADINQRRKYLAKYFGGSNDLARARNVDGAVMLGNTGQQYQIEYTNSSGTSNKTTFTFISNLQFHLQPPPPRVSIQHFDTHRATYVRLGGVSWQQLRKAINSVPAGGYLLLDFRSGGQLTKWNKLLGKFTNKKVVVAKYYSCDFKYPGYFAPSSISKKSFLSFLSKKFKGNLIVLTNETVQSSMEFNIMMLKAAVPQLTIIGRNTAGADGAATSVLVQDNVLTYFTRDVVLWPNGNATQGTGIVPDVFAAEDLTLLRAGKDAVLEKALDFINTKTKQSGGN